jgi:shikimate kinase
VVGAGARKLEERLATHCKHSSLRPNIDHMIIELQGQAGVGKMTVGRALALAMDARLIDNHVIYNPALATTEFGSTEFYETVRSVRQITFRRAENLPRGTSIIVTVAATRNREWAKEWQMAVRELADRRSTALFGVHVHCDPAENGRRLRTPSRALLRKLTDPSALGEGVSRPIQLDHCDKVLELDASSLGPSKAAERIEAWVVSES